MSIKLICSDVDGTILPHGGEISDRTRAAVKACGEAGVPFVICSGRWYVSAKTIADAVGQTEGMMIVANGGAVVNLDGSIVKEWRTSSEDARRIYEIMRKYDVMLTAFVRNAVYRVNTQAYSRFKRSVYGYLGDGYRLIDDDRDAYEREGLVLPYKMEAYGDDYEALAKLKAELIAEGFSVSSSYVNNIEVMGAGFGKGTAVKWLAEHLGATKEECMAFGDNTNDQTMLDAVGWGCAVGNAVESLKANARVVVPKCEDDGVAQTIEKALRGEIG